MRRILIGGLLITSTVLVPTGSAIAAPVTVDCDAGDSLQAAVTSPPFGSAIEVFGVCEEQIVINEPMTIIGGGPGTTIDASTTGTGNAVTINSDRVTLRRLTITGATIDDTDTENETGHGVYVSAAYTFALIRVRVEHNEKDGVNMVNSYGTVAASRIRDNGRLGLLIWGGCCGVLNLDGSIVARNGSTGIYGEEDETLIISNSYIQDNAGAGIGVYEDLYMVDTVVRRNDGGGVYGGTGRGFVRSSRIVNNGGVGIYAIAAVHDSLVKGNNGTGILDTGIVTGTRVARNAGAGIDCSEWSSCLIADSAIRRNTGTGVVFDGSFPGDTMRITGSEIALNTAGDYAPGAIDVIAGDLVVHNTTVRRNTSAAGAAIRSAGTADIAFTTIFRNSGPGGVFENTGAAFSVEFGSSIVYGHRGAADSCTGGVRTHGYNVIDEFGCPKDATDFNGRPLLTAAAYNGGPTLNHLPSAASPAVDRVPARSCTQPVDQRGAPRPAGPACDSGSVERQ